VRNLGGQLTEKLLVLRCIVVKQYTPGDGIDLHLREAGQADQRLLEVLEPERIAFGAGHLKAQPAREVMADMGGMQHTERSRR